jgi:hypothetical protein
MLPTALALWNVVMPGVGLHAGPAQDQRIEIAVRRR